jgi:hypothetical protein
MTEPKNAIIDRVNPRMFRSEPLQRCELGECKGACCVFGVWVDLREVDDIMQNSAIILPFMPEDCRNPSEWFAGVEDNDPRSPSGRVCHTAVENRSEHYQGTACIFWLSDGKCALQVAADANGLHPWRFKPFYCILHPLDLDEKGRITLDEVEEMVNEPGSCVRAAPQPIPLVKTFEPEFRYLLGEKGFQALLEVTQQKKEPEDPEK